MIQLPPARRLVEFEGTNRNTAADDGRPAGLVDWSAEVVPGASMSDLDPSALVEARKQLAKQSEQLGEFANELESHSDAELTDALGLTDNGQVTRAAMLLLGKASAEHLLPCSTGIVWRRMTDECDYRHFSTPLLLSEKSVLSMLSNGDVQFGHGDLPTLNVKKFDDYVLKEGLSNAIAHQDYARGGRVVVQEYDDRVEIISEGGFFQGDPQDYVLHSNVPTRCRNPLLLQGMVALGMADSVGLGVHGMYAAQVARCLPLPDYDLSDPNLVRLTIYGCVMDESYTDYLMRNPDLHLTDALMLDRMQKGSRSINH
jgi:ATP-dependent DNA helicase RecG